MRSLLRETDVGAIFKKTDISVMEKRSLIKQHKIISCSLRDEISFDNRCVKL